MIVDSRRVRTLRLKSEDPANVRLAAQLVSDALRFASFPGDGLPGRLLIRRVDLGALSSRLSPQALATRVTDAVRTAVGRAVPFSAPEARNSNAVRMPRDVDAWIELARRAAGHGALDLSAWFWQSLLPSARESSDRRAILEFAVDTLTGLDSASPALAALLVALVEDGTAAALLEVVSERQALIALGSLGFTLHAGRPEDPVSGVRDSMSAVTGRIETEQLPGWHADTPPGRNGSTWSRLLRHFVPRWGAEQARSRWLCATALWASVPSLANVARTEARVRALARRLEAGVGTEPQQAQPESVVRVSARDRLLSEMGAVSDASPLFTPFAGLFFVLPVLERLGLRDFLALHPHLSEADFGRRVLLRIANALGVPEDDPVRQVVTTSVPAASECAFEIPARWIGSLVDADSVALRASSLLPPCTIAVSKEGVPLALWYGDPPPALVARWPEAAHDLSRELYASETAIDVALDAWQHAIVAWLRTFADLDLDTLVRRGGGLQLSPTHVDLIFDLEQSDVRLRRPALDLDPGYVPQLGRVVAFHYRQRASFAGNPI